MSSPAAGATDVSVGGSVGDVMIRHPKVLAPDATVREVRAVLRDDHVHMVLLVSDGLLHGTLVREDLMAAPGGDRALELSRLVGRTVGPDAPAELVRQRLVGGGLRRLAVVDRQGRLLGLLCLKRRQTGFCGDADVAARAAEHRD